VSFYAVAGTLSDGKYPIIGCSVTLGTFTSVTDANGEFSFVVATTLMTMSWDTPWHYGNDVSVDLSSTSLSTLYLVARPYVYPEGNVSCGVTKALYEETVNGRSIYRSTDTKYSGYLTQIVEATLHLTVSSTANASLDVWTTSEDGGLDQEQVYVSSVSAGTTSLSLNVTDYLIGRYGEQGVGEEDTTPFRITATTMAFDPLDWSTLTQTLTEPGDVHGDGRLDGRPTAPSPIPTLDASDSGIYKITDAYGVGEDSASHDPPYYFVWCNIQIDEIPEGTQFYLVKGFVDGQPDFPSRWVDDIISINGTDIIDLSPDTGNPDYVASPDFGEEAWNITDLISVGTNSYRAYSPISPFWAIDDTYWVTVYPSEGTVTVTAELEACVHWWECYERLTTSNECSAGYVSLTGDQPLSVLSVVNPNPDPITIEVQKLDGTWVDFSWIDPTVSFGNGNTVWAAKNAGYHKPTITGIRTSCVDLEPVYLEWKGSCISNIATPPKPTGSSGEARPITAVQPHHRAPEVHRTGLPAGVAAAVAKVVHGMGPNPTEGRLSIPAGMVQGLVPPPIKSKPSRYAIAPMIRQGEVGRHAQAALAHFAERVAKSNVAGRRAQDTLSRVMRSE